MSMGKLHERLQEWLIGSGAWVRAPTQSVYYVSKVESLEAEVQRLRENEKRHLVVQSDNHDTMLKLEERRDFYKAKAESAEAEVQRLTEENAEWERWNTRCRQTKEEWGKQLTVAESRLAKAQEFVKPLHELSITTPFKDKQYLVKFHKLVHEFDAALGNDVKPFCKLGGCNCFPKSCQKCPSYLGCAGELTHGEVKTFVEEYERNLKELAEIDDDGGESEKK